VLKDSVVRNYLTNEGGYDSCLKERDGGTLGEEKAIVKRGFLMRDERDGE